MKILFAIKTMNNASGGAERVLALIVNALVIKGYDITLLTFDKSTEDDFYEVDKRVRRISLGIGNTQHEARFIETFMRMILIRRLVRTEKPDVIIPFMHSMFIPLAFALIGMKTNIIASEHIVPRHYKKKMLQFLLLYLSSFLVKKITVLSDNVKSSYPATLRFKMVVMVNPVQMNNIITNSGTDKGRKILLNVGRLSEQKDQKTLIFAFSRIQASFPDWDLHIVGEGIEREVLENIIQSKKLEHRVFLLGRKKAINEEYEKSDIFVMSSLYESFGLATVEAMAYGLPVIGFADCPGTNEVIKHNQNGILVQCSNNNREEMLGNAMATLIKRPTTRMRLGTRAQKDALLYNPEAVILKWENLIHSMGSVKAEDKK